MEEKLRPTKSMGWNIAVGGGMPPIESGENNPMYGRKHTLEAKERMSESSLQGCSKAEDHYRYGDHRTYIERYGEDKAKEIKQKQSEIRKGSANHNACQWRLTSQDGVVEIIEGGLAGRLKELGLSRSALCRHLGEIYKIRPLGLSNATEETRRSVGWRLEKIRK
jgi:hypothetical protein